MWFVWIHAWLDCSQVAIVNYWNWIKWKSGSDGTKIKRFIYFLWLYACCKRCMYLWKCNGIIHLLSDDVTGVDRKGWVPVPHPGTIIISPNEVFGDIMVLASPPRPPRHRRHEHSNPKNIQHISFKFYMRVDTPMRYFAIEIWYPPMTRTTAFTAKWHLYPPNLQNSISR